MLRERIIKSTFVKTLYLCLFRSTLILAETPLKLGGEDGVKKLYLLEALKHLLEVPKHPSRGPKRLLEEPKRLRGPQVPP